VSTWFGRPGVGLPADEDRRSELIVAVGRQDAAILQDGRRDVAALAVHPVAVLPQKLEAIELVPAIQAPGPAVIVADQGVAASPVTGQLAVPDVVADD